VTKDINIFIYRFSDERKYLTKTAGMIKNNIQVKDFFIIFRRR